MNYFDCFNGDADGICALTQLRLAHPVNAELITGVKRDIALLKRISPQSGDRVTVLDVSLDKNRQPLIELLDAGADVFYCDHHYAGDIPASSNLTAIINTSADVCTSLLINKYLQGQFLEWAVVGTFGDNLKRSAEVLAKSLNLSRAQLNELEALGIYLNYNGYGSALEDLYFDPADLFKKTVQHSTPSGFIQEDVETFETLKQGYHSDMAKASSSEPIFENGDVAVFQLPNEAWARRVSGVFGNDLANLNPARGHAVITERGDDAFVVSVRAPLERKTGADEVCRQFETGGGRAAAAGINRLENDQLSSFIESLSAQYKT